MEDPASPKLLSYRKRTEKEIIGVESDYMKALPPGYFRSLGAVYYSRRFRRLGALYYENKEECGEENHEGYVSLWSTLALVETLMATIAIQPLITTVSLEGWRREVFGLLWLLTLLGSFLGLMVTAIFLGYLLTCPRKLTWIWICKIWPFEGLPILFIWMNSIISLFAIGFSTWTLYGPKVGIPCVIVEVIGVGFTICSMWVPRFALIEILENAC